MHKYELISIENARPEIPGHKSTKRASSHVLPKIDVRVKSCIEYILYMRCMHEIFFFLFGEYIQLDFQQNFSRIQIQVDREETNTRLHSINKVLVVI